MSKDEAIKIFNTLLLFKRVDAPTEEIEECCKMAIKALQKEPMRGHWIKGYTFPDGAYWKCDKCNELIKVKFPMNYCNNCGAYMREVEE